MLIPSIDLYNGQAVQWRQGKEKVLARDDVFELLDQFSLFGEVAIIDLNATLGEGTNQDLIVQLLRKRRCRVGGGIRDLETARRYLKAGASRIILGTAARAEWVEKLPRESLIFAIDAKGDDWVSHGWRERTSEKVLDLIPDMARRCAEFLYTQVDREGMLQGIDEARIKAVCAASPIPVTVAGGITTLDDIRFLNRLGANGQLGMAIYTGKLDLIDCLVASLDFDKAPLVPTIVQDVETGEVLMLAYSNEASLRTAIAERRGVYFSRSRQQLWRKGDTSGHAQTLHRVDIDCDGDTLLFQVSQHGHACHFPRWSCFPSQTQRFRLSTLDQVLRQRQETSPEGSYSAKLFADAALRAEKLREECEELLEAQSLPDVRWEAADVLYFALIEARAKGVSLAEIENELRTRMKNESVPPV